MHIVAPQGISERYCMCTGTLAYGINMPCRTVAFAGDHIFLNSLQFCQMSGRAGRRGFDTLGHVIFMEVPHRKVASLMVSPVPQLHGNFPLSVTLVLRALTLQGAASIDPEVTNDMLRLMQKPFFASEDPNLGQKMQHMFSFALVYLQRQVMLNSMGQACAFAGMATHLFWSEPANYAFVSLLRRRVFHTICENAGGLDLAQQTNGKVPESVARQILLIMSHLFERVRLARSAAQDSAIRNSSSRSASECLCYWTCPSCANCAARCSGSPKDSGLCVYLLILISCMVWFLVHSFTDQRQSLTPALSECTFATALPGMQNIISSTHQ